MVKEVPIPYVRSNQWGIVIFVVLSIILQQPVLIFTLLLIEVLGLLFGAKFNVFIRLAKPFLTEKVKHSPTESLELQRFNNSICVALLFLSSLSILKWEIVGYVFASMVAVAAFAAICGYCVGCMIYFQFKQWKIRRTALK